MRKLRRLTFYLLLFATFTAFAWAALWLLDFALEKLNPNPSRQISYGVTFSAPYAKSLGLDPTVVYLGLLDDLKVKKLRLPVYWNEVEKSPGQFDFSATDNLLDLAQKRGVGITLAIGYKVPRWPECFPPPWFGSLTRQQQEEQILHYLGQAVNHFKGHSGILAWQVENEPLLSFGPCQIYDEPFLKDEVRLVKSLDSRPVVLTDSGELGLWITALRYSDLMGTSLYRTVYNPIFGFLRYPFPPLYYRLKAAITQKIFAPQSSGVLISELQAEPWAPDKPLREVPVADQVASFSISDLREVVNFTAQTHIRQQYLWGAEWWYFMKTHGHPEYWEFAKTLF